MNYILNKQNFINATNIDTFFLHGMNWRVNRLVEMRLLAFCDGLVFNVYKCIIYLFVGTWDVHGVHQESTATALHQRMCLANI
jgi:hypothetical protein